jgi:hypothetical protein
MHVSYILDFSAYEWGSDYRRGLDWWLDLVDFYTTRDYYYTQTGVHSDVFASRC